MGLAVFDVQSIIVVDSRGSYQKKDTHMGEIVQPVAEEKRLINKWLVLAAIILGSLLTPLDSSVVNTVLPTITTYFHTDISIVQWVPVVYMLAISCLIMLNGRLGDMIGHKRIFLYGLVAFTAASILCGSSQNIWMLISFRVLQGFAASMIVSVGFALVVEAFPATERGKALGFYATGISVAMAIGPTIGGAIAEHLGWRYIFFINIPIGTAALIWGSRVIPQGDEKPAQRLDLRGAFAVFVFLPTLLLYFNRGEEWGWASPVSLALLAVAVMSGVWFLRTEQKSKQPMLPLALFANRLFSLAILSYLFFFIAFSTYIFLTPFYLKFVLDYSIFKVGLIMITYPVVSLVVAPLIGTISDRFGTRVFTVCGMCIFASGLFLLSNLNESSTAFDVVLRLGIISIGGNMFGIPNNSTVMGNVPPQYMGIASGLLAAIRYVGMVFGIAIAGAILYSLAPITASIDPASFSSSDLEEFMHGLHWAYLSGAAAAATSALTSILAIRRHPGA